MKLKNVLFTAFLLLRTFICNAFPLSEGKVKSVKNQSQERRLYDFVVPRDGNFREALRVADSRQDTTLRFRIFIQKGQHIVPTEGETKGGDNVNYPDPRTWLRTPNVSIIGEDRDATIVQNITPPATWHNGFNPSSPLEGIGNGDVLIMEKEAHHTFLGNFTLRNAMEDRTGRNIALHDRASYTICDNMCLWAYQDTYVSNKQDGLYYFHQGVIRGRTDYICGKGDAFFDEVTFQQCGTAGYICAPSVPRKYGYVMSHCYIKQETPDVTYYLGRPWGKNTPTASWVSTKVDTPPITRDKKGYNAWADMGSGGWPARFAEYATTLTDGTMVSLEGRRSQWTDAQGNVHINKAILTAEEASMLTRENVMGDWQPWVDCEPAQLITSLRIKKGKLTWKHSPNALLYAICKDGYIVDFTTNNSYTLPSSSASGNWSIRVANQMGMLSDPIPCTE